MVGNPNEWSKIMGVFYQFDDIRFDDRHLEGSIFLFDNEDHPGRVYIDNKVYNKEKGHISAPFFNLKQYIILTEQPVF